MLHIVIYNRIYDFKIYGHLDKSKPKTISFLDLPKAFDTKNHKIVGKRGPGRQRTSWLKKP